MAIVDPIRITGLRELQARLKAMDGESQKQLRVVLNQAAEIVVTNARPRIPIVSGAARGSLKVSSSQREARVKGGSAKVGYFGWLDFGGRIGPGKRGTRPFVKGGRYVYPAYYDHKAQITDLLNAALIELAQSHGLDVS